MKKKLTTCLLAGALAFCAPLSSVYADDSDVKAFEYSEMDILREGAERFGQRVTVCAGQSSPGWGIENVSTNFTTCGGGWDNIWHLINLNNAPTGREVVLCARSPVPSGWVVIGRATDFTRCGRNQSFDNLKRIRKL